ncbi:MAG: hypothetical protein J3R72DRAFT_489247 [Linnemannia gamsii]|nr:MAG: hypothetical protein J3R72DRAFT_489247 [Linnemannia gamsii]
MRLQTIITESAKEQRQRSALENSVDSGQTSEEPTVLESRTNASLPSDADKGDRNGNETDAMDVVADKWSLVMTTMLERLSISKTRVLRIWSMNWKSRSNSPDQRSTLGHIKSLWSSQVLGTSPRHHCSASPVGSAVWKEDAVKLAFIYRKRLPQYIHQHGHQHGQQHGQQHHVSGSIYMDDAKLPSQEQKYNLDRDNLIFELSAGSVASLFVIENVMVADNGHGELSRSMRVGSR